MTTPYIGEIRMFAGNFAPVDWLFCAGQLLSISQYDALFNLIGTTYGGDGQSTFALPNLQSRLPIHATSSFVLGEMSGVETVTLSVPQMAGHGHALQASTNNGALSAITNNVLGSTSSDQLYVDQSPTLAMGPAVGIAGGSQSHSNIQPYLCLNFIIALFGVYPPQS